MGGKKNANLINQVISANKRLPNHLCLFIFLVNFCTRFGSVGLTGSVTYWGLTDKFFWIPWKFLINMTIQTYIFDWISLKNSKNNQFRIWLTGWIYICIFCILPPVIRTYKLTNIIFVYLMSYWISLQIWNMMWLNWTFYKPHFLFSMSYPEKYVQIPKMMCALEARKGKERLAINFLDIVKFQTITILKSWKWSTCTSNNGLYKFYKQRKKCLYDQFSEKEHICP